MVFFAAPTSTNYALNSYDFGNGGGMASSGTYGLNSSTGSQSGSVSSANYGSQTGLLPTIDANVPPAATLTNPANYYNKLRMVIASGTNAADVRYAIAISTDGFASVSYVQSDTSIASQIGIEDFKTYAGWGGGGGFLILGLTPGTSYQVRVSAMQGNTTQSSYGPASTAVTTELPSLSFAVSTSQSVTPPFVAGFDSLAPGGVVSANADPIVNISTNSENGGTVYIRSANGALGSVVAGWQIASATADLGGTAGYGAQVTGVSQIAGGPLTIASPYGGASDNVGILSTSLMPVLETVGPLNSGTATLRLKARSETLTPAANDYSDVITLMASMNF